MLYNIANNAAQIAVKSSIKTALQYESARTKDTPPPPKTVPVSGRGTNQVSTARRTQQALNMGARSSATPVQKQSKFAIGKDLPKIGKIQAPQTQSFQQRHSTIQTSTNNQAAAANLGFAGASMAANAGAISTAALGPLAVAAFGIMAVSRIEQARTMRKALIKAQKNERDLFIAKSMLFENRQKLEDMAMIDTLNQVERRGQKNSAALDIAKGESVAGTTLNLLKQARRRNELEYKERLVDQNVQKRIAQREHLVAQYHATRVKMEDLASQAPSNSDVALGIVSDGIGIAASYYGATS